MALTDEQRDAIIAAAIKDAKAGKPSLLQRLGKPRAPAQHGTTAGEAPRGEIGSLAYLLDRLGIRIDLQASESPSPDDETDEQT